LTEATGRAEREAALLMAETIPGGKRATLAWIIHDFTGDKRKDALKGLMNTGF
jgi:hypothetical protein